MNFPCDSCPSVLFQPSKKSTLPNAANIKENLHSWRNQSIHFTALGNSFFSFCTYLLKSSIEISSSTSECTSLSKPNFLKDNQQHGFRQHVLLNSLSEHCNKSSKMTYQAACLWVLRIHDSMHFQSQLIQLQKNANMASSHQNHLNH